MPRALVVDADSLGRNQMRIALEHHGVQVVSCQRIDVARTEHDPRSFDVVSLDADQPADGSVDLLRRLRRSRWRGSALFTAELLSDPKLQELTRDLGVRAVFMKPLSLAEVQLRLGRVVPGAQPGTRDDSHNVPDNWSGALRRARKEYGRRLPVWVKELVHNLREARSTKETRHLGEAARLGNAIATEAGQHAFPVISEVAAEIAQIADDMVQGKADPTARGPWERLEALVEVLDSALPDQDTSLATVNTGEVETYERRVLLVTSDMATLRDAAGHAVEHQIGLLTARDPKEAAKLVMRKRVDAAILAGDLPHNGAAMLTEWLHRQPGQADLPVAFLAEAGESADPDLLHRVQAHGAHFIAEKPLTATVLVSVVQRLTKTRPATRPKVLLVDDDRRFSAQLVQMLAGHRVDAEHIESPRDILDRLEQTRPDVLVLDVLMPIVSGLDVARQLRGTPAWAALPIIFLTETPSDKVTFACLRAGGDACLAKPVHEEALITWITALLRRSRATRDNDPVTGALTRQAFLDRLRKELDTRAGERVVLAAGILDVDYFSEINRIFGYVAGEKVLATIGHTMEESLGDDAIYGRWGADQIAIALPGETRSSAQQKLTGLAQRIRSLSFQGRQGRAFQVSVQIGVSATDRTGASVTALMREADAGLKAAKEARRA